MRTMMARGILAGGLSISVAACSAILGVDDITPPPGYGDAGKDALVDVVVTPDEASDRAIPHDDAGVEATADTGIDAATDAGVDATPDAMPTTCDPTAPFNSSKLVLANAAPPRLSPDELTMYFTRKPSGRNDDDLWFATRASRADSFGAPQALSSLESNSNDWFPSVTADGLTALFDSDRSGQHIYIATRTSALASFGSPQSASVNSAAANIDFEAYITPDGDEIWFTSNRAGGFGDFDIWHSNRTGNTWSLPTQAADIDSDTADQAPVVSADGLTIYFTRWDKGLSRYDVWTSHRASRSAAFPTPTLVDGHVNTSAGEFPGWLSMDNCRLYFQRGGDAYVAERSPVH